jgi:Niemann-Pick C2 protein
VNCTFQFRLYILISVTNNISAFVLFPAVDVHNVTGKAYWVSQAGDLPFVGMNTDGCLFTTCPIVAGSRQSYVYQLNISKKFPVVSGGVRL